MDYEDDLPPKREIFEYWEDRLGDIGIAIERLAPACWACGFHYGERYDVKGATASRERVLRAWERIPLQRCHIVPRMLEGAAECCNLFLMCRECHDSAPNTPFRDIFFEWARRQDHDKREHRRLLAALGSFDLEGVDILRLLDIATSEAFSAWAEGKSGLHRPQSNYPSISFRLTPATRIGLAVKFMREEDGVDRHPAQRVGSRSGPRRTLRAGPQEGP